MKKLNIRFSISDFCFLGEIYLVTLLCFEIIATANTTTESPQILQQHSTQLWWLSTCQASFNLFYISIFIFFYTYFYFHISKSLSGALNSNYANSNMSHIQDNFIYFSFKPMQTFLQEFIFASKRTKHS